MTQRWQDYEEVATYLLGKFAAEFGLDHIEGKQPVSGRRSGTKWEIDAKGVTEGSTGFVMVECRRYTTSKQSQEKLASLAYRISDAGADGRILVSPLGFQEGAAKVAKAENVCDVRLDENSTRHEYVLKFLNKLFVGVRSELSLQHTLTCEVEHQDGRVD